MKQGMRVSVVIPAYNEAGNIGRLVAETLAEVPAETLGEIVVVDDCSDDATGAEVKAFAARHANIRYLRHGKRAGQSAGLRTGILAARYPVIATMDGDGQNDPRDIPRLLERLAPPGQPGAALVGGMRKTRKDTGSKRFASRFANWLRAKMLVDGCPDTGCGVKVFWREAFLRLPFFTSMHRFLPALFQTYGHAVAYVAVNDRPRLFGHSKYTNFSRALIGLYDLFGVTWLRRRTKVPPIVEDSGVAVPLHPGRGKLRRQPRRLPQGLRADTTGYWMSALGAWWANMPASELMWVGLGFLAQLMFTMRFVVQWLASERARRSVLPETFWYFSFIGGAMLLAYAIYRLDPVFILGQAVGLFIYSRNIFFVRLGKREALADPTRPRSKSKKANGAASVPRRSQWC